MTELITEETTPILKGTSLHFKTIGSRTAGEPGSSPAGGTAGTISIS